MKPQRVLAVVSLSLALTAGALPADAQVRPVPAAVVRTLTANPGVPFEGAAHGDVTVVEYLDYNCPYCKKMHPEIQSLLKADPKVRVLYKQWPVFGEVSVYAASVALAAQWQGKHLAVHNAFMTAPGKLDSQVKVRQLAKDAGVDLARLDRDLVGRARELAAILKRSDDEARLLGLQGTPALVVGDTFVPGGMSSASLQRLVAQERQDGRAAR
uniref:DsbA family protein n=1 Tax=uncultured Caulobacter sp. TaxID=158749 RepID=UPI002600924B|nr:DsbA family protein [uncultured Caulobacter sp.]